MPEAKDVIIVEDEFLIMEYLSDLCDDMGVRVVGTAANAEDALSIIREKKPKYVLMDVRLGGRRDGVDVAMALYEEMPDTRVIFITGSNEPPTVKRIKSDHPYRILFKPFKREELEEAFA